MTILIEHVCILSINDPNPESNPNNEKIITYTLTLNLTLTTKK